MSTIALQDNGRGGTADANNREYGGTVGLGGNVVQSPAGAVANPSKDSEASITHTVGPGTKSIFHSHPSGTVVVGPGSSTIGGTTTTSSFVQAPSKWDVGNAGSRTNYVFGRGDNKVYIYNNKGVVATIPMNRFVTPKN